jgi:hypothetical protein
VETNPSVQLWKLQSEQHDDDPREDLRKVGGVMSKTHERWRDDLQIHFCKSLLPPPMSPPLDQHRVAHIEVSIVCTEGLICT